MSLNVDRKQYANILYSTTGDRIRLGDTEMIIEIEKILPIMETKPYLAVVKPYVMVWGKM